MRTLLVFDVRPLAKEKTIAKPKRLGYVSSMPTVLRIDGLRVVIYPNDHRPEHVHVIGGGGEAVFNLRCRKGPPELREDFGFARRMLVTIIDELANHVVVLCQEWRRIHGAQ